MKGWEVGGSLQEMDTRERDYDGINRPKSGVEGKSLESVGTRK